MAVQPDSNEVNLHKKQAWKNERRRGIHVGVLLLLPCTFPMTIWLCDLCLSMALFMILS